MSHEYNLKMTASLPSEKKKETNGLYSQDTSHKDIHPGGQDPLLSQITNDNDDEWIQSNGDCLSLPTCLLINMRWIIKSLAHYFLKALVNSLSN